jgi:hypothetical protein
VLVAPASGALVVVEAEEADEGTDGALVVVRGPTSWCRALEQLVATIARASRTSPVAILLGVNERIGRCCPEALVRGCRRSSRATP